jgi:hypothetical protein
MLTRHAHRSLQTACRPSIHLDLLVPDQHDFFFWFCAKVLRRNLKLVNLTDSPARDCQVGSRGWCGLRQRQKRQSTSLHDDQASPNGTAALDGLKGANTCAAGGVQLALLGSRILDNPGQTCQCPLVYVNCRHGQRGISILSAGPTCIRHCDLLYPCFLRSSFMNHRLTTLRPPAI